MHSTLAACTSTMPCSVTSLCPLSQMHRLLGECEEDSHGKVLYAEFLARYASLVQEGKVVGVTQVANAVHQAAGLWRVDATAPDYWRAEEHARDMAARVRNCEKL